MANEMYSTYVDSLCTVNNEEFESLFINLSLSRYANTKLKCICQLNILHIFNVQKAL